MDDTATMRFGKYKGLLIADIITFDPQYLLWAQENLSAFSLSAEHELAARMERSKRNRASMERQNAWAYGFGEGAKKSRSAQDWADIKAEHAARAKASPTPQQDNHP